MGLLESPQGVAAKTAGNDVILIVPSELLVNLQEAWKADDTTALTTAVRDLFDGQDGHLVLLTLLGI